MIGLRSCLVILIILLSSPALYAQGLVHQWSQRFGDASEQQARRVSADAYGNVIVTGSFRGTVDFGGGPLTCAGGTDIHVAKFNPSGNHLWSHRFGDATYDQNGRDVAVDASGNVIVAGAMAGTVDFGGGALSGAGWGIFVVKFDPSGNHVWSRLFGDDAEPWGVAVDGSGNVIVAGWFTSTVDFGGGPLTSAGEHDIFVVKFDLSGNHLWSRRFGDTDQQICWGVATDPSGNVIVTGWFDSTVDFGGGPLTSAGGHDIYLAKFDSDGSHVWSQRFGDPSELQSGWSVAADVAGNVIFSSRFQGTVDFGGGLLTSAGGYDVYVAKFDPTGSHLWSQSFGDADDQMGWGLAVDAPGNVIISGTVDGTVDFGGGPITGGDTGSFAAKFDQSGNHLWSQAFGRDGARGHTVAVDAIGSVILAGGFLGTVDFGGGPLTSAGDYDIYLAKFVAPAVPTALQGFHSYWTENHIEVAWRLIDMDGELTFDVLRREGSSEPYNAMRDAEIHRRGSEFLFEDHTTDPGVTYQYWVVIYEDGDEITSFETAVTTPSATFSLAQNHPNPFNPATRIEFSLERAARVTLAIYEPSGRLVATLLDKDMNSGTYAEEWDGRDESGKRLASGIYFYRLTAGKHTLTRKAVLLK
ncbi:MAG: T9SS type A sorting domain-containing protein [Candidatus Krumholzibacteria bacterium]|nr:T9SS type A sorting domain-containing protein [Candidatus Krumholzibacteria bacterium]